MLELELQLDFRSFVEANLPTKDMASSTELPAAETQHLSADRSVANTPEPQLTFVEQPRLKGRARLVAGLQRISSSHSIRKIGRSRANTYNGSGRGAISCISLNSSSSGYASPFDPSIEHGHTVPLNCGSTPSTPSLHIPAFDERSRRRMINVLEVKTNIAVPIEIKNNTQSVTTIDERSDYFAIPSSTQLTVSTPLPYPKKSASFLNLPAEIRMHVLSYLSPREVVRCSAVSRAWHKMAFDGQLWAILDTADFYQDIPADALVNIITNAGPFVRDLNLRGCLQLRDKWHTSDVSWACSNLENFSLEGCKIDRGPIHNFLHSNRNLVHLNLTGLVGASNNAMKIIATHCPKLEHLNVSWCTNVDTTGLRKVVAGCPNLKDLRAGEIAGWDDLDFALLLFERNTLERLVLMHCDTLTDEALSVMIEGRDNEIDYLTQRPMVPPRKLRHLDLTRCRGVSDQGVRTFINNLPSIEGLQLSKCHGITDTTLTELFATTPLLTHLDLEELEHISNAALTALAASPCAANLHHLSISYCEHLGDTGMLSVLRACTNISSLEMDNTRVSDLVLAEAAAVMRQRTARTILTNSTAFKPTIGLRLVAYDCQNVTWTGVREILSRNAEVFSTVRAAELPPLEKTEAALAASASAESLAAVKPSAPRIHVLREHSYPTKIIALKCFYTYQPTVEEHTKRVLRGDFASARRLERKWADFMIAQEEAGAGGAGGRRRRRRAREAQMMHADEEDSNIILGGGVGGGRRRRARSGGCAVM